MLLMFGMYLRPALRRDLSHGYDHKWEGWQPNKDLAREGAIDRETERDRERDGDSHSWIERPGLQNPAGDHSSEP